MYIRDVVKTRRDYALSQSFDISDDVEYKKKKMAIPRHVVYITLLLLLFTMCTTLYAYYAHHVAKPLKSLLNIHFND